LAYLWHTDGRTLWPVNTLQLQFLISILAGWVNRGQQDLIEYLQEENRVLREQLGAKRLLFTDVQRCRLAAKARKIGRKGLFEIGTLVTPDTLLRWYRRLIAKKYDGSQARRAGRPKTAAEIERLILRMARDNPRWGYTRIRGALRNLSHEIGRNTIKRILLENGFDPTRFRRKGWYDGGHTRPARAAVRLASKEVCPHGRRRTRHPAQDRVEVRLRAQDQGAP
jgi:hypothetical protein